MTQVDGYRYRFDRDRGNSHDREIDDIEYMQMKRHEAIVNQAREGIPGGDEEGEFSVDRDVNEVSRQLYHTRSGERV